MAHEERESWFTFYPSIINVICPFRMTLPTWRRSMWEAVVDPVRWCRSRQLDRRVVQECPCSPCHRHRDRQASAPVIRLPTRPRPWILPTSPATRLVRSSGPCPWQNIDYEQSLSFLRFCALSSANAWAIIIIIVTRGLRLSSSTTTTGTELYYHCISIAYLCNIAIAGQ